MTIKIFSRVKISDRTKKYGETRYAYGNFVDKRSPEERAINERALALQKRNNQINPFSSKPSSNTRNGNRILRAQRRMLEALRQQQSASTAAKGNSNP